MGSNKALTALVVALTTISAVTVSPQPVSAAYVCADNKVCFYDGRNYTGTVFAPQEMYNNYGSVPDFSRRVFTNGTNANDRTTSIINNTGWIVLAYTDVRFDGFAWVRIGPDSRINLEHTVVDNQISSAKFQ
ncbi:peptidase inhibitor family I36 protein [Micromonospora sp. Llam7]|uniref:peptidase inhibitor family I36 protein n=1 Tax=Micromonospora tarapacensis TaxID=2835305 RepID=UPI001C832831|nr:peptidase inhibitor family I36 protein [Micromonospora tarapacensis]MBX7267734.1 peptidase inhibitor family I36 protein [Micromonospora tarapacensis]